MGYVSKMSDGCGTTGDFGNLADKALGWHWLPRSCVGWDGPQASAELPTGGLQEVVEISQSAFCKGQCGFSSRKLVRPGWAKGQRPRG